MVKQRTTCYIVVKFLCVQPISELFHVMLSSRRRQSTSVVGTGIVGQGDRVGVTGGHFQLHNFVARVGSHLIGRFHDGGVVGIAFQAGQASQGANERVLPVATGCSPLEPEHWELKKSVHFLSFTLRFDQLLRSFQCHLAGLQPNLRILQSSRSLRR